MSNEYMIVDGLRVELEGETNILAVIRKAGIELPTFCYYSELSIYGACRMCVVEDERGAIITSCSTPPKSGLSVKTNTERLYNYRRTVLELLLASHCRDCTTCEKSGKCRLQELARRFGITRVHFGGDSFQRTKEKDESSLSIVRDPNKCILCGDCVRMCSEIQGIGAIDFIRRGSNMSVGPAFGKSLSETECVNCGQCAAVCPTGALVVKNDTKAVWQAIYDPKKRVVAQVAPAVRVALGEEFGLPAGRNVMGMVVTGLHMLGFDEVFDTTLGADLTVMEETKEFLERLEKKENLPLFTSCCPAWVKFAENKYPQLLKNISTCKSPQQMFGSVIKEKYKEKQKEDGLETFVVSIMPCTAKKSEAARSEFIHDGVRDVDCVITTQELAMMFKELGMVFSELEPESPDMPFGIVSGAGLLFGVTGGVSEAVVRRVVADKSLSSLHEISFLGTRGLEGCKEAELAVGDGKVRIAVVNGLKNADELVKRILSGEAHYDIVEVMACPGGCIGGAGQPFSRRPEKQKRAAGLYKSDRLSQVKRSEENPMIASVYSDIVKENVHSLLHVSHK